MLEGAIKTSYSEIAPQRPRLTTPGGSVAVSAVADTAVSTAVSNYFGYLFLLEAICTVAAAAAGTWTLKSEVGGATLLVLHQPDAAAAIGTRYCWSFPVPWKTAVKNASFVVRPSAATLGTWQFHVNGFLSSV